ncbi:hypothetical protein B0G75_101347 [Paraburkholderia sp. BL18I3N2]|uniref:hypothetical protein n=1 Tax=Paraburkholderia sp. BL18I3N2 TaxID=1938799 RepID=UPI000D070B27|nr:hypothetical protein [Paraburkholderia sp. BL18I3N2]PRX36158.1 hypothetical protein B0G75_101347 [Paraburkholderia sp. BL18I3N2]
MKLFLISDLVVQELAAMKVDGKWLSPAQFTESALLWINHYAPGLDVPESFFFEVECEVLQIATQLAAGKLASAEDSPLAQLFGDYPTVNYAHPLSAKALAATLAACREKISSGSRTTLSNDAFWSRQFANCVKNAPHSLGCHPTLCQLMNHVSDTSKA